MKKITLLIMASLMLSLSYSQTYLNEGFQAAVPPTGWIDVAGANADSGNLWAQSAVRSNTGGNAAVYDDFNADNDRWLISPAMDLSGATTPEFTYYDNVNFASFAAVQDVLYSTDYTGSGDPTLATWTSVNAVIGTEDTWVLNGPYALPLSATVYVAFHYNGNFAAEWYIDDVLVQEPVLCTAPSATSVLVDDCVGGTYTVDVTVDSLGDATTVSISNDGGVATTANVGLGTYSIGPFPVTTPVSIVLEHDQDSQCNVPLNTFNSSCAECPTLDAPSDGATGVAIDGTISWTAAATGAPATSWAIYFGTTTPAPFFGIVGDPTVTALTFVGDFGAALDFSTVYYWSIVPQVNGTDVGTCAEFSFTTEGPPGPPANDDVSSALSLTPTLAFNDGPLGGQTNVSATASEVADPSIPAPGCANYSGGDVWYSVVVPDDGNIILEADSDPTASGGDGGGAAYSGTPGAFVLIECDDDDGPGLYPQIIVSDPTLAGQTIYFRVFGYGGATLTSFRVAAHSTTLSNDEITSESNFSYFPNPVKNTLTLNAQNNIEDVRMYNMLGQEVMNAQPQAVDSDIDMSSLETGTYFVQVTIASITKTVRVVKQ